MKNSNKLKTIVSSVLIASSVALINGCCTSHKGGAAYYSSYESPPPATTTEAKPAETTSSGSVTIPLYEESVAVGKREVDAGTVTIKKVVKTETVNQPVELRRETISIDRQPASGTASSADQSKAFTDQQYTIQLHNEEPVVEKRVVQTGQVVASKQATTQQTTVQREIRKEDVAVDKGNAQVSQGAATGPGGESQGYSSGGTITDVNNLSTTTDAASVHGRTVQFSNAKVVQLIDPSLIVVGGETGQTRVYVHLQQPVENLKAGDTVSIMGTVKQSSKATDIMGGLSSNVSQTLTAQPFFIEAQSCQKSG